MYKHSKTFQGFEHKLYLASPTMHGDELAYMKAAYDTNWLSTVGENINEIEKQICEYVGCKYA
ncbi:MAG: DegT/DnrJ/EryC1/StrS family aminotransferase, partial [Clostridium sp.]|nr:DegT/DnrJ/EryC1/StrS family aminotransferase [Clostridium sp.]MCM1399889.1 DegT/DnrJ/EryC1/StrS family aminotransferase [Clostridium sp.]MCM1460692.1 DegT/DnrJ/EryC1/StrS family aminotransferase [Bacteroides sp.]